MPEVEMVCNRAIIINKGKIEASDSLENLQKKVRSGTLTLHVKAKPEDAKASLSKLEPVFFVEIKSESEGWVRLECQSKPGEDICEAVDLLVKKENWPLREFNFHKPTLEDVFVELTQE